MSDKLLTREQILAAPDMPYEDVSVPEWGGVIRIRGMSVAERTAWESSNTKRVRDKDGKTIIEVDWDAHTSFRERLVMLCAIDEDGNRLFSDDDMKALAAKSAVAMERVVNAANRLNGVSREDLAELEGNSAATGDSAHYTGSPVSSDNQSLN